MDRKSSSGKIDLFVQSKYDQLMGEYRQQSVRELLPSQIKTAIDNKFPLMSAFILQKGIDYFSSDEGKYRIEKLLDDLYKTEVVC